LEQQLTDAIQPHMLRNEEFLKEIAQVGFERSFYENAWALDQAVGVRQAWGQLDPNAVRAAVGLADDVAALGEVMSEREAMEHKRVLDEAFENYRRDTRRWIGREVTQGVIQGESVDRIAKRLDNTALMHSQHSAMTIARTETLRATGLGGQMAYDRAAEKGVQVRQVWDATLDSRTRPRHAQLDGKVRDEQTGAFAVPGIGNVAGPRRSGIASFDINCRCTVRPEIEGYSPRVRRTREDGIQPYQTFEQWARRQGITANRFGERYSFLD
jgi:SPP1 gp7 family putative phage head morphogenesis protein